jgi:hypothetical protein
LVEALEDALGKGLLDGKEIFLMFSDNSTAESAFFKGSDFLL